MITRGVIVVASAFLSFALVHTLTVSRAFKIAVCGIIGETRMRAYYRLCFTLVSVVTAAFSGYVIAMQPDTTFYRPQGYIYWPARAVQFAGIVIFFLAQKPFDTGYFTGIRQATDYVRTGITGGDLEGIPANALVTNGIYGLVRNPMYLAGILIFMFEPVITANNLVLRTLAVAYFIWGGYIEERRYAGASDGTYEEYRRNVPKYNIIAGLIRKSRNRS